MNKSNLLDLISCLDNCVEKYAIDFNNIVKPIERTFNIQTHNTQEFTNAYIATKFLETYFLRSYRNSFCVRELPISYNIRSSSLTTTLSEAPFPSGKRGKKRLKSKGKFSVDAYFNTNIIVESDFPDIDGIIIEHLFVEYKVSDLFKYLSLAEDFIKYKIYTFNNEQYTAFSFINFSKRPLYPTILKAGKPDFVLLPRKINQFLFSANDRVFIYIPKRRPSLSFDYMGKEIDNPNDFRLMEKIAESLHKINNITESMSEDDVLKNVQNKLRDSIYCNNIGIFKNHVSTANVLLENYQRFIKPLFLTLKEKQIINETSLSFETIMKIKSDFRSFEAYYFSSNKINALNEGLSVGYKSSFDIIVLFKVLADVMQISLSPVLKCYSTEGKEGSKEIDYNSILNSSVEKILNDPTFNKEGIVELAINILLFLVNLYEEVFIFDDSGNFEESNEYKLLKASNRIQKILDDLRKTIDCPNRVNIFGKNILQETMNLCQFLIEKFEYEQ